MPIYEREDYRDFIAIRVYNDEKEFQGHLFLCKSHQAHCTHPTDNSWYVYDEMWELDCMAKEFIQTGKLAKYPRVRFQDQEVK